MVCCLAQRDVNYFIAGHDGGTPVTLPPRSTLQVLGGADVIVARGQPQVGQVDVIDERITVLHPEVEKSNKTECRGIGRAGGRAAEDRARSSAFA